MEPNAFIAEVYRRMAARHGNEYVVPSWKTVQQRLDVGHIIQELGSLLPTDKGARILDIGFGEASFLAACVKLGYENVEGADFGISAKQGIKSWSGAIRELHDIETTIPDLLAEMSERYDFIHMSHVIEHIPKYSLLYVMDSLYNALRKGGTLLLRTPNMEGPCALSSYYVTLGHEYGFSASNLRSLFELCNFDDVQLHSLSPHPSSMKQWMGNVVRRQYLKWYGIKHRFFGVNQGRQFGSELVMSGRRADRTPLLSDKYR